MTLSQARDIFNTHNIPVRDEIVFDDTMLAAAQAIDNLEHLTAPPTADAMETAQRIVDDWWKHTLSGSLHDRDIAKLTASIAAALRAAQVADAPTDAGA